MKNLILTALVVTSASALFADKLTMQSGTVLTGTIVGIKDGVIKFTSDDFGELNIDPAKVKAIEDAKQTPMQVVELKVIPKEPETWHGSVNLAFLAARGNTVNDTWSIIANLNRRWEKDRVSADFGYYYGKGGKATEDPIKNADRWEAELKHDHFWAEKIYSFEDLRFDRDMIRELRARYRVGLGLGYQWLDGTELGGTGKWSFNQELGGNWVKEEYENNPDVAENGFAAVRYGHHLGWVPPWRDGVEIFHNAEYLPQVDDLDKFLVKADVGFSTKIVYNIDLLFKIEWDFDSKPQDDLKRSDLRYIGGLGYKW